jgi:hypothetical protein
VTTTALTLSGLDEGEFAPWAGLLPGEGMWLPDDLPAESYHGIEMASCSRLNVLLRSPEEYWATFIAKTLQRGQTKAMRLGTMLHVAVLEPHRWERSYCLMPPKVEGPEQPDFSHLGNPRTKAYRAALAEWREKVAPEIAAAEFERDAFIAGRTIVKPEDFELVLAMAEAIAKNPHASAIVSGAAGLRERSMVWRDPVTGVLCRGRTDVSLDLPIFADLKSIFDPRPDAFMRACVQKGYHRQAAMYLDGGLSIDGVERQFPFVVVHNKPPHEVAVYELEPYAIQQGREQYRRALAELAHRNATGDWLAHWQSEPRTIAFPSWAWKRTWDEDNEDDHG